MSRVLVALTMYGCAAVAVHGQGWNEVGDAGELPANAQMPIGVGPLPFIMGNVSAGGDVDMYRIHIPNPAAFEARTWPGSAFDTQLWLFDLSGNGVTFNDDDPGQGVRSRITGAFVPGTGDYYLAVSAYDRDALDPGALEIWLDAPFNVERAPDGPGAPGPVASWGGAAATSGGYQIELVGVNYPITGLGRISFGPIDLQSQTGNDGHLGIVFLNDVYYGSARGLGAAPPHLVYTFDRGGLLTGQFNQHPNTSASDWGYRDGATDGTFIYFGDEGGLYRHNADGSNPTLFVQGGAPGGVGTWRALAFDPTGNAGNGSFWTADFGSALIEVDLSGNLLTTFPNTPGWSLFGLALDPVTFNLWGHSMGCEIVEIDTTTGLFTGVSFPAQVPCLVQGGLSGVPDPGCRGDLDGDRDTDLADLGILLADFGCAPPPNCVGDLDGDGDTDLADLGILLADFGCRSGGDPNEWDIITIEQSATSDTMTQYVIHD